MEETIGKAGLRDAAIGTGIAVDKMLALTGQMPSVNIDNIWMPTEAERRANYETDRNLDRIVAMLSATDEGGSNAARPGMSGRGHPVYVERPLAGGKCRSRHFALAASDRNSAALFTEVARQEESSSKTSPQLRTHRRHRSVLEPNRVRNLRHHSDRRTRRLCGSGPCGPR